MTAVDGLDLDVPEGTCVGLLGPNGAGKSTTMKMLTAQAIADAGEITRARLRGARRTPSRRARCAASCRSSTTSTSSSPRARTSPSSRACTACRATSGAPPSTARSRSPTSAERADTPVDKLSGGMRRRLLIARALVHRPRLLLLDEPTVGLDPQVRQELWALIDALRSEGTSILMSTHYIEEAERLADTVSIMAHGQGRRARPARRARARARRASRRSRSTGRRRGWPRCARRPRRRATACAGPAPRWRSSAPRAPTATLPEGVRARRLARGRLRAADRGGDRVSATTTAVAAAGRDGPPAPPAAPARAGARSAGVMSRDVTNFKSFWKTTTFSSILDPTIYLLAFGLGLGHARRRGRRDRLRRSSSGPAWWGRRCCSRRRSRRCTACSSSTASSTPTTRSSPRRSTSRSSSRPRSCGSALRAGVYGVRRCS